MSNLKDIVFTVWRELEGGYIPDDTRFTYKNIRTVVTGCVGQAASDLAMKLRNSDPDSPYPEYYVGYESAVKYDERMGASYAMLQGKSVAFNGSRNYDVTNSVDSFHRKAVDFLPTNPQEWFNLKRLPRVPNIIHYMVGTNRLVFMNDMSGVGKVQIQQSFFVPTAGGEDTDIGVNIPDEIGAIVLSNALAILREELRPSDRANDGVPSN